MSTSVPRLLVVAARELAASDNDYVSRIDSVLRAARRWPAASMALQLRLLPAPHESGGAGGSARERFVRDLGDCIEERDPDGRVPVYWNLRAGPVPHRRSWTAHLPESMLVASQLPASFSASIHSQGALQHAGAARFVVFAPVFAPTWKDARPAGVEALAEIAAASPVPVLALGGITPARVALCLKADAAGVAIASGILAAADIAMSLHDYAKALDLEQE